MKSDKTLTIHFSLTTYIRDENMMYVSTGVFNAVRIVDGHDSVRNTAISVIREGFKSGIKHFVDEISSDSPIDINLKTEDKDSDEWSGWGIRYALNEQGHIVFLNGYDPLTHDWTFDEIFELVDNGYIKGDPTHLTIDLPSDLGGGFEDVFEWMAFIEDAVEVISLFGYVVPLPKLIKRIKLKLNDKKHKQAVKQWTEENRIKRPEQIREFFDLKNPWKLAEVKKRLGIGDDIAIELLTALGYKPKGENWFLCQDAKSTKRREKWLKAEKGESVSET